MRLQIERYTINSTRGGISLDNEMENGERNLKIGWQSVLGLFEQIISPHRKICGVNDAQRRDLEN